MKLKGLNTVITGASQGLGRVIAEHFLREGASCLLCARDPQRLEATRLQLAALTQPGQKLLAQSCDVSDPTQVDRLATTAFAELKRIHVLVNNAGIYGPMGPTETVDWKEWTRALEVNLYGVLLPCRAFVPHFKKEGSGKIIILSGGGATNPMPNISAYAASKAAVVRLMETLALELKADHIDVNAIAPGALRTRMVDQVLAAGPEKVGPDFYAKNLKWAEQGATSPELGAGLAVYLASSQSDGITGRLISAQWDPWEKLHEFKEQLNTSDIYTLRRIVPEDRGQRFQKPDAR